MAKQANTAIQPPLSLVPAPSDATPAKPGEPAEFDDEQPRSALAKVGIGAGVAASTGLLGYGIYRLGKWAGWWGSSVIVIDDLPKPDDAKPTPTPNDGGDKPGKKRATGLVPNPSGNAEGYNTTLFPAPLPVRLTLKALGYPVEYSTESLYVDEKPNPEVTRFQREWNKVIKAIDAGAISLPSSGDEPKFLGHLRGVLDVDGVAGKQTLNGLEIAFTNQIKNALKWRELVQKA
ncbi:hypothetical protein ACNOYE_34770 [Nannocystaceae bacterium ST9]